jgi:hypothetical protein
MLNVVVFIVAGSIGSLNVTVEVPARDTPVAPFAGDVAITCGAVMSTVVTVDSAVSIERSDTIPDSQFAATEYTYVVCGESPVSVKLFVVDSPTFVPLRKTL